MQRFVFLDSYRGLLAFSVITQHLHIKLFDGKLFGVIGFFLLSSFLLTYRLTKLFYAKSHEPNYKSHISVTISYFITRFYRIYIPYIVFCLIQSVVYNKFRSIFPGRRIWPIDRLAKLELMTNSGTGSHLWTIPIEIRYYLFIPIFSFLSSKLINHKRYLLCLFLMIICYLIAFNKSSQFRRELFIYDQFVLYFPVFFLGSLLAVTYLHIEMHGLDKRIKANKHLDMVFNYFPIFMLLIGVRSHDLFALEVNSFEIRYSYAVYWTILLFFMLIGYPNKLTDTLESFKSLRQFGKFSFGIYLFHPIIIQVLKYRTPFKYEIDCLVFVTFWSYLLGLVFFHIIEDPLLTLGTRVAKRITKAFKL